MAEAGRGVVVADFAEVLVNGRWPLRLPKHRADRPFWQWWERERLAAMRAAVRPGDVVVDVGAEMGDGPALWASWGAEVVIIEPAAEAWPCIRATWDANTAALPLACFAGFADQHDDPDALVALRAWPGDADGEWVDEPGFRHADERPDLPRLTVDALAATLPDERVDVLTIDVEGAEIRVLRGALGVLLGQRPTVLLSLHAEQMWTRYGEHDDDLLCWLGKVAGYEVHPLAFTHGERHLLCCPKP